MKNFSDKIKILLLILLLGAFLRLFGIDWDQGQHLHPDERFLTMVGIDTSFPKSFADYLNPLKSTLNPYNVGYSFYVYGTLPLYLVKLVSFLFNHHSYSELYLVGRFFSALFDLGVVYLLYLIGGRLFSKKVGLFASFFYSIMVLPIQLSHFFTVDTFLNFFIILCFYLLTILFTTRHSLSIAALLGVSFGLAVTSKVSAIYFLPEIIFAYLYLTKSGKEAKKILFSLVVMTLFTYLIVRLTQPSLFAKANLLSLSPNPQFISNIKQLSSYNDPNSWYPPGVQWKKTSPIFFPLKNLLLWGLGLPLGIFSLWSFFELSFQTIKNKISKANFLVLISLVWILGLFFYLGVQQVKTMRYFLSLYPFLALFSAWKFERIRNKKLKTLIFILAIIYPLSFISIYTKPITRVSASRWIYRNIPIGSTLANEYWDDGLPLFLPNENHGKYSYESLSLYDPENEQKWEKIESQLENTDYIILSSNRLYGSIPKNPEYYPQTTKYYKDLFDGSLGFKKVAEFSSYPCFPPFGKALFCFNDDSSEEAFTVYDHPKVIIFKKVLNNQKD